MKQSWLPRGKESCSTIERLAPMPRSRLRILARVRLENRAACRNGESMSCPKVLVIYNEPVLPLDHPDAASEQDILETVDLTLMVLDEAGFSTRRTCFSHDPRILIDELRDNPPDVVFNLFEGIATQTGTEASVAALLEWMGIPFTGSPSNAIALGLDKVRTKRLLSGAGVPTAEFLVIERAEVPIWPYEWPAIVKPAYQDCSIGIDQGSVVTTQKEFEDRIGFICERYGLPILAEQFISGREFHASIIEDPNGDPAIPRLVMVPLAEIRFDFEPGVHRWPIYSYAAKWDTDSAEYNGTPFDTPVHLAPMLMERISRVAADTYKLIGLRDYGRIDLRLTEDGRPYVLEANPNPYLYSVGLIKGLEAMGRTHPAFVADVVRAALARGKHRMRAQA
jgi:D-alanine-D-alanine ligase